MPENWKGLVTRYIKLLDKKNEILTEFDEENKKIDFISSIKQYQKQKFENEAYIRVYLVLRLIKELDYTPIAIELEKTYSIGHPSPKKKSARLDILVNQIESNKKNPFMLIEVKTPKDFENQKEKSIKDQLFAIAKQEIKGKIKPKYLVYYTINIEEDKIVDNAIVIDFENFSTYEDWKKEREPSFEQIPKNYGIVKKSVYANIPSPRIEESLIPLRKNLAFSEFEKLRIDLHNNLYAGGEADFNDIFYHLIKIFLVKVYDEIFTPENECYKFQIIYSESDGKKDIPETPEQLLKRLDAIYRKALKDLLNFDEEKIKNIPLIEKDKFTIEKLYFTVKKIEGISLTENIHIREEDVLGLFFERILQEEFKQAPGQYFTHKNIVKFLIYALELDIFPIKTLNQTHPHFPYIIDPSAGSGTFLINSMRVITKSILENESQLRITRPLKQKLKELKDIERRNKWAEDYIYGIEPNTRLGLAAKLNMILHGDGNMNIFIDDGLMPFMIDSTHYYTRKWKGKDAGMLAESSPSDIYPKPVNNRFDVVLSNPPFSLKIEALKSKKYLDSTFSYGDKKNSENLFIERWFQLLKPKGRLGAIVPESILDTSENLYIRNFLYNNFNIKAIISLPAKAFEPYTSTKVSLLIAEKKSDEEIKIWNKKWQNCSNKYNKLRNKVKDFFFTNNTLRTKLMNLVKKSKVEIDESKVFAFEILNDELIALLKQKLNPRDEKKYEQLISKINNFKDNGKVIDNLENEEFKKNIKELMKEFYPNEEFSSFKDFLEYINFDMLEILKLDFPNIRDQNNYCNSWWVFTEVINDLDFPFLHITAENIGYKRTKRNLFDTDDKVYDDDGNLVSYINDLIKIKAKKVIRKDWEKKGKKLIEVEKEEILKEDIIINIENPETALDVLRKAKIWAEDPDFSFLED